MERINIVACRVRGQRYDLHFDDHATKDDIRAALISWYQDDDLDFTFDDAVEVLTAIYEMPWVNLDLC